MIGFGATSLNLLKTRNISIVIIDKRASNLHFAHDFEMGNAEVKVASDFDIFKHDGVGGHSQVASDVGVNS